MINIYYQNCRGVKTKLETLKLNMANNDADIVALTETWLNVSVHNQEFNTDRFIIRKDRNQQITGKKQGGGVLLAIKKKFVAMEYDCDLEVPSLCETYYAPKKEHLCYSCIFCSGIQCGLVQEVL